MKRPFTLFAAAIALSVLVASAGATECPEHYAGGTAPQIVNQRLASKTHELCFEAFAVVHSGITRTPLWSAEHLTRDSVSQARSLARVNNFHPEPRLPAGERAELSDFARSGLDRGHMAPSGDMPNPQAQGESFSLANMIPQDANLNRHLWEGIEGSVRNLAQRRGSLYVITGPLFEGERLKTLKGRVLVPTSVFKLVYDPRARTAAAYVAANEATSDYSVVSLADLERRAGVRFLPGVAVADVGAPATLPPPRARGSAEAGSRDITVGAWHQAARLARALR